MKKALVLGASGGMGYSIVNELTSRGIAVNAFARTQQKLEKLFQLYFAKHRTKQKGRFRRGSEHFAGVYFHPGWR